MKIFLKFLPILLVLAGVILWFAIPVAADWVLAHTKGFIGLGLLSVAGLGIMLYFALVLKFSRKSLLYALGVVVFVIITIWLLANHEAIFAWMDVHLGSWGTVGVLLIFCLVFYIVMRILF